MDIIRKILIGILIISIITFVALFGRLPALRRTPIGWLQRALCLHIPSALKSVDRRITGGTLAAKGKRLGHYLFFQKNPLVLVRSSIIRWIARPTFDSIIDPISLRAHWKCCTVPVSGCTSSAN